MIRRMFACSFTVLALVVMTVPGWAKSSPELKTTIDIDSNAKLMNTSLAPGEYNVIVDGNQAKFERDGKVVAEVPCSLKTLDNKAVASAVEIERDQVTEFQFAGKNQAVDFATSQSD